MHTYFNFLESFFCLASNVFCGDLLFRVEKVLQKGLEFSLDDLEPGTVQRNTYGTWKGG